MVIFPILINAIAVSFYINCQTNDVFANMHVSRCINFVNRQGPQEKFQDRRSTNKIFLMELIACKEVLYKPFMN